MISRELAKAWREADWGPADADAFVASAGELLPADVAALADLGKLDPTQQRARAAALAKMVERSANAALFVPLVRAMKTAPVVLRDAIAAVLPAVNDPEGAAELCDLLRSPDQKVRQLGVETLKKVGGKRAVQGLVDLLGDAKCPGRIEAIDALVPLAGHHALATLSTIASSGSAAERVHALKWLGDARYMAKATSGAVRAIAGAIADSTEGVAVQALLSLGQIASEDEYFEHATPFLESTSGATSRAAIQALKRFKSPRTIAALRGRLQTGPTRLRFTVLETLEAIGTPEVLPLLVDALSHRIQQVRQSASDALARLSAAGKIDLARSVVWLLRSRDVNVRRLAADLARSVKDGGGDFWIKVLAALRDEDWWVRERVMDALVETAGWQVAGYVVGFLQEPAAPLRRFAVDVLARLKRPESIPAIVQVASSDPDWWVRERAVEAIAAMGDERAGPFLLQLLEKDPEVRVACLDALGTLKAGAAEPQALAALADPDPSVRLAAMRFFETTDRRVPDVAKLAGDPSPDVARAAHDLLVRWNARPRADADTAAVSKLDRLLIGLVEADHDDLLLEAGLIPHAKRLGAVAPMGAEPLSADEAQRMVASILTGEQLVELERGRDLDFSYELPSRGLRFRANVFRHRDGFGAVFRKIRSELPNLDSLGLPPVVQGLADLPHGLVLVGGPTGSGKSTTLAALVAHVNECYPRHVITLEDPIEAVHRRKKGLVNQREVGTHAKSFERALRATLREDPDVILVGEMRDAETIRFAVAAADTGHLVFATVHTTSADAAIDRLVGAFPPGEQQQIRSSLSTSLRAVVCQALLPRVDKEGRVLALEVLLNNEAIANLIRKGKCFQIPSLIATSREAGMRLMDHDLVRLVKERRIAPEEALLKCRNRKEVEAALGIGAKPEPVTRISRGGTG